MASSKDGWRRSLSCRWDRSGNCSFRPNWPMPSILRAPTLGPIRHSFSKWSCSRSRTRPRKNLPHRPPPPPTRTRPKLRTNRLTRIRTRSSPSSSVGGRMPAGIVTRVGLRVVRRSHQRREICFLLAGKPKQISRCAGIAYHPCAYETRSVASAFEADLTPEHAVDEDEVSESHHDSDQPPEDPDHQTVMSGGG